MFAELYKIIFKAKEDLFKFIPILVSVVGGLLGLLIFFTYPAIILEANNPYTAFIIGFVSGASSTGANQIIKHLFNKKNNVSYQI